MGRAFAPLLEGPFYSWGFAPGWYELRRWRSRCWENQWVQGAREIWEWSVGTRTTAREARARISLRGCFGFGFPLGVAFAMLGFRSIAINERGWKTPPPFCHDGDTDAFSCDGMPGPGRGAAA